MGEPDPFEVASSFRQQGQNAPGQTDAVLSRLCPPAVMTPGGD
jgi:hypothetical protein